MRFFLICLVTLVGAASAARSQDKEPAKTKSIPSPDKQWEYRCSDGLWSSIFKTKGDRLALDLTNEIEVPYCKDAEVIWSADSKRFAINYSPPHAPHTTYVTCAFYELSDGLWVSMDAPIDDSSATSFAQLAEHLPRGMRKPRIWDANVERVVLKVLRWSEPNTAVIYVHAASDQARWKNGASSFLFTVKFPPGEAWKIVEARALTGKEVEQEISGPE